MANQLVNKIFSGTSLMQLVQDADESSKTRFENEETEAKLSFFLIVRKTFNEAYEKIREQLVANGKAELGEVFSGITGEFVRGSYSERGGSAYQPSQAVTEAVAKQIDTTTVDPSVVDPEFFEIEVKVKPKSDAIRAYVKQHRELPPGVEESVRSKSLALQPTKSAKQFLDDLNASKEDVLYDLDIPEITDEEDDYGQIT